MGIKDIAEELGKVSISTAYRFSKNIPYVIVNGRRRWRVSKVAKKVLENEM